MGTTMKHSSIVILDSAIRNCWYGQGPFGVSAGLKASADMKRLYDSSGKGNVQRELFVPVERKQNGN